VESAYVRRTLVQVRDGVDGMSEQINPTHLYKGKPVELVSLTHRVNGKQFCTIKMVNKNGTVQRQSVQVDRLTALPVMAQTPDVDSMTFSSTWSE